MPAVTTVLAASTTEGNPIRRFRRETMIIFSRSAASSGAATSSRAFTPHKNIHQTRGGHSNGGRMPMASLLVTAHCNWKLLLSGFVCLANYNKVPARRRVCTDVAH